MYYIKTNINSRHNILITGARGLIGTALTERLKSTRCSIFCQSRAYQKSFKEVRWVKHDLITDRWSKCKLPNIHYVFHLAGQTSIYEARKNPINDLNSNVLGLLRLLDYLKLQKNCPIVILAGTATQVGLTKKIIINEKTKDIPCTFYDISKLCAEFYLMQYIREGWIRGCVLRLANVYGQKKDSQSPSRGILDKIYSEAITGKTIRLFVNKKCKRDYLYINDVISALLIAAKHIEKTNGESFYLGSQEKISIGRAFNRVINLAALKTVRRVKIQKTKPPTNLYEIVK